MKSEVKTWTIKEILRINDQLLLDPRFQRGEAWKVEKRALLIDSILMGYDIPKLYLARSPNQALHKFSVIDGQQRIRSILHFFGKGPYLGKSELKLRPKWGLEWPKEDNVVCSGLSEKEIEKILNYKITVSIVKDSTAQELRRLFLRLQMGSPLNQSELRNALASNIGDQIATIVENHEFFKNCRISSSRFKQHDYLAHAALFCHYLDNEEINDLSAEKIKAFYLKEKQPSKNFWTKIWKALDELNKPLEQDTTLFNKKWVFVDFFGHIWSNIDCINQMGAENFASTIQTLDEARQTIRKQPEKYVGKSTKYDKDLFLYCDAFFKDGGLKHNVHKRKHFLTNHMEAIAQ